MEVHSLVSWQLAGRRMMVSKVASPHFYTPESDFNVSINLQRLTIYLFCDMRIKHENCWLSAWNVKPHKRAMSFVQVSPYLQGFVWVPVMKLPIILNILIHVITSVPLLFGIPEHCQ